MQIKQIKTKPESKAGIEPGMATGQIQLNNAQRRVHTNCMYNRATKNHSKTRSLRQRVGLEPNVEYIQTVLQFVVRRYDL